MEIHAANEILPASSIWSRLKMKDSPFTHRSPQNTQLGLPSNHEEEVLHPSFSAAIHWMHGTLPISSALLLPVTEDLHGRNPSSEYSTNKALQKTWRSHLLHPSGTVNHQGKKQSPPLHVIRILNRQTIIRTIMTANVREYTIVLICTSTLFVWCLSICLQYASCHREHLATTSTTAQWKLTISSLSSKVSLILWSLHSICLSRASTNESLRMLAFSWTPWGRQQARRVPREIFFPPSFTAQKHKKHRLILWKYVLWTNDRCCPWLSQCSLLASY